MPLVYAVLEEVRRTKDPSLIKAVANLVRAIGMSISFRLPVVGTDLSVAEVKRAWGEQGDVEVALDDAFARPLEELRRVGKELGGRRIVLLVDDLDRCTAGNVVSMLESINVITDVPGFVFVLALDYDVIVAAVNEQYPGLNGHEFIDKIIQIPFRIPQLEGSKDMLAIVVPEFERIQQFQLIADDIATIVNLAFDANPRSTKRFINALMLLTRILDSRGVEADPKLVAALLAGELRWPEQFNDVRRSVRSSDAEPLMGLRKGGDKRLAAFVALFFPPQISSSELAPVLRLTAAVAGSSDDGAQQQPEAGETIDVRAANRSTLGAGLEALGYQLHPHQKNVFYHPDVPRVRFLLRRKVIRYEVREMTKASGGWALVESFSLDDQLDAVLAAARDARALIK